MKEPIEVDDIREGDKIRWERITRNDPFYTAVEYAAPSDRHHNGQGGQHYLIEPRQPAVVLPEEPTLAWATWGPTVNALGIGIPSGSGFGKWHKSPTDSDPNRLVFRPSGGTSFYGVTAKRITAFTPATAVPTEAIDRLRAAANGRLGCPDVAVHEAALNLLAAVDGTR